MMWDHATLADPAPAPPPPLPRRIGRRLLVVEQGVVRLARHEERRWLAHVLAQVSAARAVLGAT